MFSHKHAYTPESGCTPVNDAVTCLFQIVPDLPGWLPANPDNGAAYHDTFLGRFLGCSTIRRDMIMSDLSRYVSPYFNRSTVINQDISQVFKLVNC